MNIIKAILGFIFNPFNTITNEKVCNKVIESFSKYALLRFVIAVLITLAIFGLVYYVL